MVTGYFIIVNVVVIDWRSQSHKTVILYVTESEYSSITKVWCKILCVHELLLFMEVTFKYPITVYVDNFGDIFLSENTLVYQRAKHIDVRQQFICDYVEDVTLKIQFFRYE